MVSYFIKDVESAKKLASICEKYKDADIDVVYGRQAIDGKSVLGVISLMGRMVSLKVNSANEDDEKNFEEEINNAVHLGRIYGCKK